MAEAGDVAGWVTLGVLASKAKPQQTSTGGMMSIWTLGNLAGSQATLFLFGDAHGTCYMQTEGSVLALLDAKVPLSCSSSLLGCLFDQIYAMASHDACIVRTSWSVDLPVACVRATRDHWYIHSQHRLFPCLRLHMPPGYMQTVGCALALQGRHHTALALHHATIRLVI